MMGAEPTLKLKTADFWQLTLGMQLSSSSYYSEELVQIFFGLDIQIILFQLQLQNIYLHIQQTSAFDAYAPHAHIISKNQCSYFQNLKINYYKNVRMFKKEERLNERYDSERNYKLFGCVSKELTNKSSKYRNSRLLSGHKKSTNNLNSSEIYSQPQLVRPKRGASVAKNNSKAKYAQSMNKFRKEFIKNSYTNYEDVNQSQRRTTAKDQLPTSSNNRISIGQELGFEDLHYQMVKLHQNVKKMNRQE